MTIIACAVLCLSMSQATVKTPRLGVVSTFYAEVVSLSNCTVSFITCDDHAREYPFRTDVEDGLPYTGNGHLITVGDVGYWEVSTGGNLCNLAKPWVSYFSAQPCE